MPSIIRRTPSRWDMRHARSFKPPAEFPKEERPRIPEHERITVCVITNTGKCDFISDVRDNLAAVSRLINDGRMAPRKNLHVTPVAVGTQKGCERVYGVMYMSKDDVTENDETVVFRSVGKDDRNIFTGMPLGSIVIFTFDNRRLNRPTRPGTLTDDDKEFLTHHIFSKDGRTFLMAEARKEY